MYIFLKKGIAVVIGSLMLMSCHADSGDSIVSDKTINTEKPIGTGLEKAVVKADCSNISASHDVPSMVLVGTDVRDRGSFEETVVSDGRYIADIGGAKLQLLVKRLSTADYQVLRDFSEPGISSDKKTYSGLCTFADSILGKEVMLTFVKGGVLWWEISSGNEFLTSDLLYFLKKEEL